jgi:hypothetical protein
MGRRCCARRLANDNDGSAMLYPQQRRANDAVPPGPANDNNGPPMLLDSPHRIATDDSPRKTPPQAIEAADGLPGLPGMLPPP